MEAMKELTFPSIDVLAEFCKQPVDDVELPLDSRGIRHASLGKFYFSRIFALLQTDVVNTKLEGK